MSWLFGKKRKQELRIEEIKLREEEQRTEERIRLLKDLRRDLTFDEWTPHTHHHHRRHGDA